MIYKQKCKNKDKSTELSETKSSVVLPLDGIYHRAVPETVPADAVGQKSILIQGLPLYRERYLNCR